MKLIAILSCSLILCLCSLDLSAQGQTADARQILDATAQAIQQAGGIEVTFHTHSADGDTEGTIRMKGRQFVLETEGMTTWFDGRTQWTYLEEVDEVNITEPTADELQSINPYAWLSLYKQGYELKTRKVNGRLLPVTLTATDRHRQVQGMTLYIDPDTRMPRQIDMRLQGSLQPVRIVIRQCHTGLTYADSFFVFDSQKHPTAEVIDLR